MSQNECSDNLVVILYSSSDAHSDDCLVVTLYSVVIVYSSNRGSDSLYSSSDKLSSLYSVVIRESCLL